MARVGRRGSPADPSHCGGVGGLCACNGWVKKVQSVSSRDVTERVNRNNRSEGVVWGGLAEVRRKAILGIYASYDKKENL